MAARAAALGCLLALALPVRGFQGALHRSLLQRAYHSHAPLSPAVTFGSSFAPAHVRVVPTTGTWGLRERQRGPQALRMFNSGILNVGTPEMALILAVGYFVLGPQDLYKVAKETGQVWSNLRSAADDAWKVFQEAMEAEGTYSAMGKSVAEIKNMRDNFWQKFLDVRAERALDQLEEKGVNVDNYDDDWSQKIKEVKRKKQETTKKDWDLEDEDDMDLVDGPYRRSEPYAKAGPPSQGRFGRPPPPPPGGFRPPPPMFNPYYMRPPFPPPPPMVPPPSSAQGTAGPGVGAGARGPQAQRPGWVPPPPPPPMFYPYFPPPPPPPRQPIPQQQGAAAPGVAAPPMGSAGAAPQALNATARPPMPMMPWFYPPPPPPPAFYAYPPYRPQPPQPPSPPAPQHQQHVEVAAEAGMGSRAAVEQPSAEEQEVMRSKFAAQMSGQWNQLVLDQAKAAAVAAAAVGVGDGGVSAAGFEGAQESAADLPLQKSKEEAHAPQEAQAQKRTEESAEQPSKDVVSA